METYVRTRNEDSLFSLLPNDINGSLEEVRLNIFSIRSENNIVGSPVDDNDVVEDPIAVVAALVKMKSVPILIVLIYYYYYYFFFL